MAPEDQRLTAKQIDAPETVLAVTEKGQPGRTSGAGIRPVVLSQFLSVKSEFEEVGLGESDREVSHRRRSGGQKIRVGLFGPRPTGRCRCRGVPLRRPGRRLRADGHGRAPVAATGRRQWQTAASGRLGMQANQAHQVVGEHRRLDLVVEPPRNEWSARPQASRCAASARGRIRHTSRADNKADGRLWARPSGGCRNAPRGVAAA